MTTHHVITVDGLAASGKSTLSRMLAEKLGYVHFNSGMLYRVIGWLAIEKKIPFQDEEALLRMLAAHGVSLRASAGVIEVLVNGQPVTADLSTPHVSQATSSTAVHPWLREALLAMQRALTSQCPLVAEGRDMGTVVFPEAELKFFIWASEATRAERRLQQMAGGGRRSDQELNRLKSGLEIEIRERDARDQGRAVAPAVPAADAIKIENSAKSLTEVLDTMYHFALARGLAPHS